MADKYKKNQSKITWLSIRLPSNATSIELDPMLDIAIADLCIRKFSPESLILFAETGTHLRLDYLNRVRVVIYCIIYLLLLHGIQAWHIMQLIFQCSDSYEYYPSVPDIQSNSICGISSRYCSHGRYERN